MTVNGMNLHVGCHLGNSVSQSVHAVVLVEPHSSVQDAIIEERWESAGPAERFTDLYGNVCRRFDLTPENAAFTYDATVRISSELEAVPDGREVQHRVEALPPELLHWLLPSRLCDSDTFAHEAWELFGDSDPGAARVQAVCDWIHDNVAYGVESVPTTTVREIYTRRGGMCRDFAHLGVTFCRALSIPARYVFGYMPDIGIPGPFPPMDFHAWFEVYLGDRWWTYDARFNTPRIGRVPIGHGRDAVDVAMVTTYGGATLETMTVWADEIATAVVGDPA